MVRQKQTRTAGTVHAGIKVIQECSAANVEVQSHDDVLEGIL